MTAGSVRLPEGLRPGGRYRSWRPVTPRYAVVDVDGTLLGDQPLAAPAVVDAVGGCRAGGLAVGLATGRMPGAVAAVVEQLGLAGPHVLHNGAQVHADGRTVGSWPLGPGDAARLVELCAARGLYAEWYVGDGYVVNDRRVAARPHWRVLGRDPDGDVSQLDVNGEEVLKATVLLFPGDDVGEALAAFATAGLAAGVAFAPAVPDVTFVNITHPEVDKGRALHVAADHAGTVLAAVVAVGDGLNDVSMLEVAGTAVAMGQAPDEVKAAAHLVVPHVADDGVAHALRAATLWAQLRTGSDG